ncbi:DUF4198 domain-containing protein [Yoonia sediminilitoris]|uniref:Putative GH25 family protein n=1 Tax=Yoonia sediminilitoris TaxID=1286148 RepID=A0A2T6KCZ8_9RHOB|nr:DUF4198 domain-containing protein [Yoonia sediminilitoris]PUB12826.1 putative GH25 family protein [Yoonia sediminilitoris]RCW94305.1 putative GH25 family protein [Yoonia sediminilitoris]
MRFLSLALILLATPLAAHELWLEPLAYQVDADGRLEADIINGEEFKGTKLAFLPRSIQNFVAVSGDSIERVTGRLGDRPGLSRDAVGEGLNIVAYQTQPSTLSYKSWAKFQKFIDHKDLGDIRPVHDARGLPEANFKEVYTRYSKTLIGVGESAGADRRVGMETELVALSNPYTDDLSDGMRVQLYYRNDVRANEQIEVFEKDASGAVTITLYRTDDQGVGIFPVKPGHSYMVDAVVLREPSDQLRQSSDAVWETLWANMTFATPE